MIGDATLFQRAHLINRAITLSSACGLLICLVIVALFIGVTVGAVAGFVGGRTDQLLMRFVDLMYSVPGQKKLREVVVTREIVEAKDKSITLIEKAG